MLSLWVTASIVFGMVATILSVMRAGIISFPKEMMDGLGAMLLSMFALFASLLGLNFNRHARVRMKKAGETGLRWELACRASSILHAAPLVYRHFNP